MFPKEVTGEEIRVCSLSEPKSEGESLGMYFSAESYICYIKKNNVRKQPKLVVSSTS